MAGLAALLSFGSDRTTAQTLEALSASLAPRGDDEEVTEIGPAKLLVRAGLPKINESDGVVIAVDGIAETSNLFTRYATYGPTGLIAGQHPYALILADAEAAPDGLVLARNLDGPPLYYARARGAVLVASEPSAIIAAGVPAAPNEEIVTRFLDSGACDDVPATFFDGVRRVLPGQVVEINRLTDGWAIRTHPPAPTRPGRPPRTALPGTIGAERLGVALLTSGESDSWLPMAALLGASLSSRGTHLSLPVYSANFPGVDANSSNFWTSLLGPVPDGALKHKALPFFADEFDVDGFVTDLGEPAPGLHDYLLWAMAKASGGEVDVLLSALGARGQAGHLSRLADRVATRYGVGLRFPFRDAGGLDDSMRGELLALAERTLPPASVRAATTGTVKEPDLGEILHRLRAEVATALLYPRHGEPDRAALGRLANLAGAKRPELGRIWRRYVLERWLATAIVAPQRVPPARTSGQPPDATRPIDAAGQSWQRRVICLEPLVSGDQYADKIAWYTTEFVNSADRQARQALRQPWLLIVAAKAVAVAQGEARAIWRIQPGRLARGLTRLGGERTRHPDPWSMQVAIDRAGRWRMGLAVLFASLGRLSWYHQMAGTAARCVSPPREHACPPGHLAVVGPPQRPDLAAKQVLGALRRALPEEIFDTMRGCAIVGADAQSVRCLGWAGKGPMPVDLIARLCSGNPLGQADERTPLLLATTSRPAAVKGGQRKAGKQTAKRR